MPDPTPADFEEIRGRTEALWAGASIDPGIHGFQFQAATRWNAGLAPDEIDAYEHALGVRFPAAFRCMLGVMNGTDLPTINVYGFNGEPARERPGVYAYPRDLALVRSMIADMEPGRAEIAKALMEQGFYLDQSARLVPVYAHRFLLCGADAWDGPVLSISGTDAIVYGRNLIEYLQTEFYPRRLPREIGWRELRTDPPDPPPTSAGGI